MRPAYLYISKITCVASEDMVGSDDLYGILGDASFELGSYSADDVREDVAEQTVPDGVAELVICERDFPDSDDVLGTIDLTQQMDEERTFGILTNSARYDIDFQVISQADELEDRCGQACPTCGNPCLRSAGHGATVHWCGKHEWGAN